MSKEKQVNIKMDVRSAAAVRQILFEAQKNSKQEFIILDQFIFPFLLEIEFKNLIEDSIEQLNRDLETLSFKLKTINDEN